MNNEEFVWNLGYYFYEKEHLQPEVEGYERHFIRGLLDFKGMLYTRTRKNAISPSYQIDIINPSREVIQWAADTISSALMLENKPIRFISRFRAWKTSWEGNIARLITWWLYHGDIKSCCSIRNLEKYKSIFLDNKQFDSLDEEILYIAKANQIDSNTIKFNVPSKVTLPWCKRIQKLLSYNTVPVFHNKGKRKYYELYIPRSANMRDASENIDVKA